MADEQPQRPQPGPVWPDPYPSGPYASVPYPTGPYATGLPAPLATPHTEAAVRADQPVIGRIGDIEVTAFTVRTPAGEFALRGSQWDIEDRRMTRQKTPRWAIVCAVVGTFVA